MKIIQYEMMLNPDGKPELKKKSTRKYDAESLGSPEAAVNMLNRLYRLNRMAEEYMYMIALNGANRCLGVFEISHGNDAFTFCDARQVFTRALLLNARGIILAHNHPAGQKTPSEQDRNIYEKTKEAGKLLNVTLLDNIIVTKNDYVSFKEEETRNKSIP